MTGVAILLKFSSLSMILTFCFFLQTSRGGVFDESQAEPIDDNSRIVIGDVYNVTASYLNFGQKKNGNQRYWYEDSDTSEKIFKSKTDVLSRLLKGHVNRLRNQTDRVELVFLVDASGSVGQQNFRSELSFVRKLLSDFTVEPSSARVAVITFAGKRNINRNVDQISHEGSNHHKCYLLNKQLNNISYTGGGTYTRGALLEAHAILERSRKEAQKVVFLITDGFSNGGDPRPAADMLKNSGITIFTFGIRTGNVEELHDVASHPGYMHSYLLDSFSEFEALARRALHRDLKSGKYVPVNGPEDCNLLCTASADQSCCDSLATCSCGIATGHYACICPTGYFGSGLKGLCQPCPSGAYASGVTSGDSTSSCIPCPDANHVTVKVPALSPEDCACASGFTTDGNKCEAITCPKLKVPENGYLVKASACGNVVNAACGIRCRIGFHLTGDSIRLCGKDGTWSGNEAQCLLKTCPALRAPLHGRVRCQHDEDYQQKVTDDSSAYPIDTRCLFRCDAGYQLRGSKVRNCLPLSRWDGLQVTCKAIKCEPLREIANGEVSPEICLGPEKVAFFSNCTISCKKGYILEGPRSRACNGRTGIWSQRHTINRCVDKIPPTVTCPSDIGVKTLPGQNFAHVNWSVPEVTDNADPSPTIWTKPRISFPWKAKIGMRTVIYLAQDSSGNKARCKFKVQVVDKEPPTVENCVEPPIFYTDFATGAENVTWDEPIFHDNSRSEVKVVQNRLPENGTFPIGTTKIVYTATDKYENTATCVLNIIVVDVCQNLPPPLNGKAKCLLMDGEDRECTISCDDGYGFALESSNFKEIDGDLLLRCNLSHLNWENANFPDCSDIKAPELVSQEGAIFLNGNTTEICDNVTTLKELSEHIANDLTSKLFDICGNDVECNLLSFPPECENQLFPLENVDDNLLRKRRHDSSYISTVHNFSHGRTKRLSKINQYGNNTRTKMRRRKDKIEIKFKFVAKIIAENYDNPKQGLRKLRRKLESMTRSGRLNLLNNRTNHEIAKLALNLHLLFKDPQQLCDPGSVLRKYNCVKCPLGTFHNSSLGQCQACPFGEYQDTAGSLACKRCPENTFTKRMHTKYLKDCAAICRSGTYSRRRRYHGSPLSIEPCVTCDIGFYQPEYGQTGCLACNSNATTKTRGSIKASDCLPINHAEDICEKNPCFNNGRCVQEEEGFSCECQDHYIGSVCEKFQNPCDSSPCLNEGKCNLKITPSGTFSYTCNCKHDYAGHNCESYMDECFLNPCQNGGKCVSTDSDYSCECKDGFEGRFCEVAMNYCDRAPCEEGSTCRIVNETWHCICKPGFLGRHCNLLPCDWLPCQVNALCVNVLEINATRHSYRCECPDGYTGEDCTTKIDYCKDIPCMNGGKCISWTLNHTCICPITFTGYNCEIELSSDYVVHFAKSGTTDYVMTKGFAENITEFSVCLWLQSVDTFNYGTILSYATRLHDNALTLTDYNGLVLYVNGQSEVTDIKANDGHWHFLCISWENKDGSWKAYLDGVLRDRGINLAKNTVIEGNGSLVIGQEQDYLGGGFSESESFLGKLSLLDVWDRSLKQEDVTYFMNTCDKYHGTLYAWAQLREHIHGDVLILKSPFCRGCPSPVAPFRGIVNASDDLTEVTYQCELGYRVRLGGKEYRSLTRRCLKQGQWEGDYILSCTRVKCGFPGYFPRGQIKGWSYSFGDEIHYSCVDGYELRGNPYRACNANGQWSGLPPLCVGKTCKNLLAPENGDIEYIIEEHERDDISILQVGQQLEFKCNLGYRLDGEGYLTCLENGTWDHDRPKCVPRECPPPREIEHGYVTSLRTNRTNESANVTFHNEENSGKQRVLENNYYHDDIVTFACQAGYKFVGENDSESNVNIRCSSDGSWIGFVPDCIHLACFWPIGIPRARMFLKTLNNMTLEIPKTNQATFDSQDAELRAEANNTSIDKDHLEKLFVIGSELLIVCDEGYVMKGNNVRRCLPDGEWSSNVILCEPRVCSIRDHPMFSLIDNIINDTVVYNATNAIDSQSYLFGNLELTIQGISYGKNIIIACRDSSVINLKGPNSRMTYQNVTWVCDKSGEWKRLNYDIEINDLFIRTADEFCNTPGCTIPKIPSNGYIVNEDNVNSIDRVRRVGDVVQFKCRSGYILEGNEETSCLSNGTWSAIASCKAITCGNPPKMINAIIRENGIKSEYYTFGNVITYQCNSGYQIFGQASTRCLANGKWSRVQGKCSRITCGKPKVSAKVTVYGRSYLYQDQLTYICPNGKVQGFITCKADGKWSQPPDCSNK